MNPSARRGAFRAVTPYPVTLRAISSGAALPQVDLRPQINALNLAVRSQGSRGTCSVFALTFLLEYQYRTRQGLSVNDLSEEYLNHVCNLVANNTGDGDFFDNIDAGYREWGIVPEATVPYQAMQVGNVALDVLATGKRWARFEADFVKAWDAANGASQSQLDRAVAYLDEDTPVAVGGWWPRAGQWSTTETAGVEVMSVPAIADKETVLMDGHSVALVGYRRDSTFAGGGYFVFRNSWGGGWGDSGYGYMPFEYVRRFANDLVAYRTRRITSGRLGIQAVAGR
jgi:C1A family cysteine protease